MNSLNPIQLFSKASGNAGNYRIPSVIVTKHNTVVAAADERFFTGGDNPNRIDKVVRRSTDSGKTWGRQITAVKEHGESKLMASAAIDPCLLYDEETDTIIMLYSHTPAGKFILNCKKGRGVDKDNNLLIEKDDKLFTAKDGKLFSDKGENGYLIDDDGNVSKDGTYVCNVFTYDGEFKQYGTSYLYITKSVDDGQTWDKPICLDNEVKEKYFTWLGAGPGVGVKIKNGKYKGRLILPMYYNVIKTPLMLSNAVIYSDDKGLSWKRGKSPNDSRKRLGLLPMSHKFVLPNEMLTESQVIELPDGGLKMFIRNHSAKRLVATAVSDDGGESWSGFQLRPQLNNCICQLSVINADYKGKQVTLFLNADSKTARENGVIKLSYDYGETFVASKQIKDGGFVYSSMCQLPDGQIGVLYEGSTQHETIDFVKFPIDFILQD